MFEKVTPILFSTFVSVLLWRCDFVALPIKESWSLFPHQMRLISSDQWTVAEMTLYNLKP